MNAAPEPNSEASRFRRRLNGLIRGAKLETLTITPAMAAVMLERNTGNRPLSAARVAHWSKVMAAGDWMLTGESIIFSRQGILNDGQHRLTACVQTGRPFRTDVRFGIEREAFQVTGTGAKRTLADVFSIKGEVQSRTLAAALNWLNEYVNGIGTPPLSHLDGVALLEKHPELRRSVDPGRRMYAHTKLMEPALAVFLHYVFALADADKADRFFDFLTTGAGSDGEHDPRLVLRERLARNKGASARLPAVDIAALTIKAWNAYRQGKEVRQLRWGGLTGPGAEAFPRAA